MERCRFYEHQPEQQLATIKNRQAWLPFMFNFMAEKSSDGLSLFTFCDVIMKCKLTWSTDYGFQRGSFFILGIFVCEWKNLNGVAEARDVSETIIKCTFYIHREVKTAWKAVSRALWWTAYFGVVRCCRYKEMNGTSVRLLMRLMKTDASWTLWF